MANRPPDAAPRSDVYDRMGRYFAALTAIEEKCRWYAENDARDPQEVDYALCVEILALAEDALEGMPHGR